jgi:hypothetical protein
MTSKTHVIEPVPGGPRFRILCIADSTATLCQTKPYVEPVTVDVGGLDARQLAAVSAATKTTHQSCWAARPALGGAGWAWRTQPASAFVWAGRWVGSTPLHPVANALLTVERPPMHRCCTTSRGRASRCGTSTTRTGARRCSATRSPRSVCLTMPNAFLTVAPAPF